jgi:hypothetical protein
MLLDIEKALKEHTVQIVTTDFSGKATFNDIKPGSYYIFGRTQTRGGFAVWNLFVEIRAGANSVFLDQNNAVAAF